MYEPGIYRLSGSMKEVRQLKAEFTSNSAYQLTGKEDINAIASLLKLCVCFAAPPGPAWRLWQPTECPHDAHPRAACDADASLGCMAAATW